MSIEKISDYKRIVVERFCPVCGYIIAQIVIEMAVADYRCPMCQASRLSEFTPILEWK